MSFSDVYVATLTYGTAVLLGLGTLVLIPVLLLGTVEFLLDRTGGAS